MIFTKADRRDLQNIPAMLSALRMRFEATQRDIAGLAESQGKLLAALNDIQQSQVALHIDLTATDAKLDSALVHIHARLSEVLFEVTHWRKTAPKRKAGKR